MRQPGLAASGRPAAGQILLAVDEFSAVSRRLPIWQLYERARSLGLAVQVSAQSWQGLAADEDERYRIAAAADGGIWLLRTPHPEPVAALAGSRKVTDTTRRLLGVPLWSHQGTSRMRLAPVVDPALIRALDVGQAAYIYRGGATYVQVKRLVAAPAAVGGQTAETAEIAEIDEIDERTETAETADTDGRTAAAAPLRRQAPAAIRDGRPVEPVPPGLTALLDEAFGTETP